MLEKGTGLLLEANCVLSLVRRFDLLRVAMPRDVGSPAFLRRDIRYGGNEELFPCLRTFKHLETKRCPIPFLCK